MPPLPPSTQRQGPKALSLPHTLKVREPRGRRQEAGGSEFSAHPEGGGGAWFWPWVTPPLLLWWFKEGNPAGWVSLWQEVSPAV